MFVCIYKTFQIGHSGREMDGVIVVRGSTTVGQIGVLLLPPRVCYETPALNPTHWDGVFRDMVWRNQLPTLPSIRMRQMTI